MSSTGLLVVSNVKQIARSLRAVEKYVNALYIHLNIPAAKVQPLPTWGRMISQLYVDSLSCGDSIDMRVLVGPLKSREFSGMQLAHRVDMIFADSHYPEVCDTLRSQLNIASETIYLDDDASSDLSDLQSVEQPHGIYDTVVLGGTFDRIHLGHKIFLTQAVLRACRRLVVGVTTAHMNRTKTLSELILPVETRISEIRDFLMEIDASLRYDIVPIDDPFGPTQSDPDMDLIVVSAETLRGGHKVNEIRAKNNLRPLEIFCIDVVESSIDDGPKETKVSSSNTRIDLLGTRLRKPESRPQLPNEPYIIGLTGGIASGKSRMSQRFRELGAMILDCDKIAHEIYEPGQLCFDKVVQHFGTTIVDAMGRIDRGKLGAIVFNSTTQLNALNGIVWPELMLEVKRRIQTIYEKHRPRVIVVEAAVLLRANWDADCHEVWSMIVPPETAVQRVMERNKLSEADARKRLSSQLDNTTIVGRSHVVFSSQWNEEFTLRQAERAWQMLMRELNSRTHSSSML